MNQLLDDQTMPGMGHNKPPLNEYLAELLQPSRERQAEMVAVARTAVVIDKASAEKVLDLDRLIKTLSDDLERQREDLKRPYLEACRLIDRGFAELTHPLKLARYGEDGRGGLRALLSAWQRRQDEEAEAERRRLERERRQAEDEAEAARRVTEQNLAGGSVDIGAELEAMQAEDKARRLALQAAAVRPEPLRSNLGQVGSRREIVFTISDLRKALGWMLRQKGLGSQIEQAARTILGKYLRALGVGAIEHGLEIPGVEVRIDKVATVR